MERNTFQIFPGIKGIYGDRVVVPRADYEVDHVLQSFLKSVSMWGGPDKQDEDSVSVEVIMDISDSVGDILHKRFGFQYKEITLDDVLNDPPDFK